MTHLDVNENILATMAVKACLGCLYYFSFNSTFHPPAHIRRLMFTHMYLFHRYVHMMPKHLCLIQYLTGKDP